ncbi:hypothetical protein JEY40_17220 [Bradyrhizobium japonicum]|uniref:hypothetical protein n=1 Tax=Bradyrhizobium TaxID=374 RepID=UPI001BAA3975|nr:hypothetical protein [Bradyrhizobium japonicum]MBR0803464.1 hypothetical protein [Bradyrhizobium japonicum]UQD76134.1 hypothetical protein JEY40_17220 [Bradyrhizobium japonicum]
MSTATKVRLIALAVIELVIASMGVFGTTNPAVFAAVTIGLPMLALMAIAVSIRVGLIVTSAIGPQPARYSP